MNWNGTRALRAMVFVVLATCSLDSIGQSLDAAGLDPLHFKPQIDEATNEQCLSCHQEIVDRQTLAVTPAGVTANMTFAWYQGLDTYDGPQETFHRRHLETPLAKQLMDMKCSTCHQGHDPREEAPIPPDVENQSFTLRKVVNPNTCLMCHGKMRHEIMGLPGPWPEVRELFSNSCTTACHGVIRTNRHQVNFLKPEAIEKAGAESADACYGCHGGRAWYRISYPYPRHEWPTMSEEVPDWAKNRPIQSNARFLEGLKK